MSVLKRLFPFVLAAAMVTSLSAQEYRGRIQGNVLDTTQSAIAGATVHRITNGIATNPARVCSYATKTAVAAPSATPPAMLS